MPIDVLSETQLNCCQREAVSKYEPCLKSVGSLNIKRDLQQWSRVVYEQPLK